MGHEGGDNFFPRRLFYFFESISQIGESEPELGPIAFRQRGTQLRDDPISRFSLLDTIPTLRGLVATKATPS
jgi:hypothetical protein